MSTNCWLLFALWFAIIELNVENIEAKAVWYVSRHQSSVDARDCEGRRAIDIAVARVTSAIMDIFLWFGRYSVDSLPVHQSETCFVFKATDEKADVDHGEKKIVAVKLMIRPSQFMREVSCRRVEVDSEHVIDIIRTHADATDENQLDEQNEVVIEKTEVLTKQQAETLYCIVFPYVEINLLNSLKHERRTDEALRYTFTQVI
jgi:hypothetical protein